MTEIANIPPKTRVIFLSGRMQPPTKGHISFLKDLLSLRDDIVNSSLDETPCNRMVLSLGWAPIDHATQIEAILSKLKSHYMVRPFISKDEVEYSLIKIMNHPDLSSKEIEEELKHYFYDFFSIKKNISGYDDLLMRIKRRILNYRKIFVLPLTEATKEQIKKNPFSFDQRERLIRAQLSEEQNKRLAIVPALGASNAKSILYDYKRYATRHAMPRLIFYPILTNSTTTEFVYICSGEQYIDRATHVYTKNGCKQIFDAEDPITQVSSKGNMHDFATSKGYNRVLVVPRLEQDKVSGTLTREIMEKVCSGSAPIEDLYELMFDSEPSNEMKSIILGDKDSNLSPIWEKGLIPTYCDILNNLD